jgi:deoxyribodipyrimidine photo-lyase
MNSPCIVWFRQDLRLQDNAALAAAIASGQVIVPVYLWSPEDEAPWQPGGASRWWWHHALSDLAAQWKEIGSRLIVRKTHSSLEALLAIAKEVKASAIHWNRRYEPQIIDRDAKIKTALGLAGLKAESHNSGMLFEPLEIANKSGKPFQVFTPLLKHYRTLTVPKPVEVDLKALKAPKSWPKSETVSSLGLKPNIPWDAGFQQWWHTPSRSAALKRFDKFICSDAEAYVGQRDLPAEDGTSQLSAYLHFGQLGPREVWWKLANATNFSPQFESGIMRQVVWREFAHHLMFHYPHTTSKPLRPEYAHFPWDGSGDFLGAWQRGETGYPIVDAGMRQLWQTGWMHNRVRMIVGSLLVKHLLQHWLEGARWFWDTLVDADLPNNTMGWQWIGGCGADAAPYFRIFNPITQGSKFDASGAYVRRYVPELAKIPDSHIHQPWTLGDLELQGFGVTLGKHYPSPIIAHTDGRQRALEAFAKWKAGRV